MTDKDKLIALIKSFGIGYTLEVTPEGMLLKLSEGDAKVDGYPGFYTWFEFEYDGGFRKVNIGE